MLQRLLVRTLSALVMAPVALAAVWAGGWWFAGGVFLIALYGTVEWNRITGRASEWLTISNGIALALAMLALMEISGWLALVFVAGGCALVAGLAAVQRLGASWPVAGLAYLGVAMVALIWLRETGGWLAVLWVLLIIWSSDIGAYLSGSLIGGPKLAPRLSPNKTWAGLIGGAVLAGLLAALFALSAAPGLVAFSSPVALFLIGFLLAVWSQLGDILESSLKRRFNVKDSGNLIPGHGGVLDRIDSLIFTVPVVALAFFLQNPHGVPLNG